jgi:hypothetical protein
MARSWRALRVKGWAVARMEERVRGLLQVWMDEL